MKRIACLALALLLLIGCTNQPGNEEGGGSSSAPNGSVSTTPTPPAGSAAATMTGTVFFVGETPFLFNASSLYSLPTRSDIPTLLGGEVVEIGYDGFILESWPAQFANVSYITISEERPDVIAFWLGVLEDLMETDPALNEDAEMLTFDFTKATLSPEERDAFLYAAGCIYGVETYEYTFEALYEAGLVDPEKPYFEHGLHIMLEVFDVADQAFGFHIQKWRSALGAYGFHDCTATLKDGIWTYVIGEQFIS